MSSVNSWQEARAKEQLQEAYLREAMLRVGLEADIVESALERRSANPPMSESHQVRWLPDDGAPPPLPHALRHLQREQ